MIPLFLFGAPLAGPPNAADPAPEAGDGAMADEFAQFLQDRAFDSEMPVIDLGLLVAAAPKPQPLVLRLHAVPDAPVVQTDAPLPAVPDQPHPATAVADRPNPRPVDPAAAAPEDGPAPDDLPIPESPDTIVVAAPAPVANAPMPPPLRDIPAQQALPPPLRDIPAQKALPPVAESPPIARRQPLGQISTPATRVFDPHLPQSIALPEPTGTPNLAKPPPVVVPAPLPKAPAPLAVAAPQAGHVPHPPQATAAPAPAQPQPDTAPSPTAPSQPAPPHAPGPPHVLAPDAVPPDALPLPHRKGQAAFELRIIDPAPQPIPTPPEASIAAPIAAPSAAPMPQPNAPAPPVLPLQAKAAVTHPTPAKAPQPMAPNGPKRPDDAPQAAVKAPLPETADTPVFTAPLSAPSDAVAPAQNTALPPPLAHHASAHATPPAHTPIHHPHPAQQVAAALVENITDKPGRIDLLLTPDDLGKVRFEMQPKGNEMAVVLSAERPETLDILRRHLPDLIAELRQAGYANSSFSFGQWGGQQRGQSSPSQPQTFAAPELPPPPARTTTTAQGMDLRL